MHPTVPRHSDDADDQPQPRAESDQPVGTLNDGSAQLLRTPSDAQHARQLTSAQRDLANDILREARDFARDDFNTFRNSVWRRLRNSRQNPDLAQIEQQLRAAGDVQGPNTGAMRVRMTNQAPVPRRSGA